MATVVKRFVWDSDLESFTCTVGTLSAMQRDAANGYSGNGSIQGYETGSGAGSTGVGNASRSLSWEDMGVPAGATVTAVQATESRTYAGLTHSSGFGSASWLCTIASSAAGWSAQTLCSRGPISTADSSWYNGSGSSVSVPSGAQASSTVCQLVIQHTNVRKTGTSTGTSTHTDYFTLTITYTPGTVTHDVVLVLESTSSVAAIGSKRTVHDVTLALESASAITVEPLVTHAIHDIILALESTSTASAEGSKTAGGTTHDITLALETTTSVVVQRVVVDGLVAEYVARLASKTKTVTIYADTTSGRIEDSSTVYLTARTGPSPTASVNPQYVYTNQLFATPDYFVEEMFLAFDTSGIPSGATVTAATFSLNCVGNYGNTTPHIAEVRARDWGADLTAADFVAGADISGSLLASFDTTGLTNTPGYRTFTSETAMLDAIVAEGTTRFMVVGNRFRLGTEPTGLERVQWYLNQTDCRPRLVVTYEEPSPGNNTDPTAEWADLVGDNDLSLNNFAYTESSGWDGDGSAADPYALKGDGTNDYAYFNGQIVDVDVAWSAEAWDMLPTGTTGNRDIIGWQDTTDGGMMCMGLEISGTTGLPRFYWWRDDGTAQHSDTGSTDLRDSVKHHYFVTFASGTGHLYVDSVEVGDGFTASGATTPNLFVALANGYGAVINNYWPGPLYTVRLYDRALTADEVAQNFGAGIDAYSAGVGAVHATHDVVLALESTSSVEAIGSKVAGGVTHDVTLALESTSAVAVAGSVTHATHDVTLALEAASAVAAVGSVTQAIHDVALALESASSVVAAGSVLHATHDMVLGLESTSAVAVVAAKTGTHNIVLALEATSSVAAVGSVTHATHDVVLVLEATSAVSVVGSVTHAVHDITLALESASSVVAVGSVLHATHDVVLALESVSSVAAIGAKSGSHDIALALESTSSVAAIGSVTHAVHDLVLALESASSVVAVGSKTGAVYTHDITLALESTSGVIFAGGVTHATHDVALTLESASSVVVVGSIVQAVHDISLALESASSVSVLAGATRAVALALESTSAVVVAPSIVHATHDIVLALESASGVTVAVGMTHATWDVTLALESVGSVVVEPSLVAYGIVLRLSLESVSSVSVVVRRVGANIDLVVGAPESAWRASILNPDDGPTPLGGWRVDEPQGGWTVSKPR